MKTTKSYGTSTKEDLEVAVGIAIEEGDEHNNNAREKDDDDDDGLYIKALFRGFFLRLRSFSCLFILLLLGSLLVVGIFINLRSNKNTTLVLGDASSGSSINSVSATIAKDKDFAFSVTRGSGDYPAVDLEHAYLSYAFLKGFDFLIEPGVSIKISVDNEEAKEDEEVSYSFSIIIIIIIHFKTFISSLAFQ